MKNFICIKATAIFTLILAAGITYAAPYCAVSYRGTQCSYYDFKTCRRAAGSDGTCVVNENREKFKLPSGPLGGAPFCVVSSNAVNCSFYSDKSCREAAPALGGKCAANPNM
jgi:hypothetical protein